MLCQETEFSSQIPSQNDSVCLENGLFSLENWRFLLKNIPLWIIFAFLAKFQERMCHFD